jgi:hypothetical protein
VVDLYSLTIPTTARKEAAARMARNAYEKRKTRAAQVNATKKQVAADAEVDPSPDKPLRPPTIVESVDVTPLRGRSSWALDEAPATDVTKCRFSRREDWVIGIERAGLTLAALARYRKPTRPPFPPEQQGWFQSTRRRVVV